MMMDHWLLKFVYCNLTYFYDTQINFKWGCSSSIASQLIISLSRPCWRAWLKNQLTNQKEKQFFATWVKSTQIWTFASVNLCRKQNSWSRCEKFHLMVRRMCWSSVIVLWSSEKLRKQYFLFYCPLCALSEDLATAFTQYWSSLQLGSQKEKRCKLHWTTSAITVTLWEEVLPQGSDVFAATEDVSREAAGVLVSAKDLFPLAVSMLLHKSAELHPLCVKHRLHWWRYQGQRCWQPAGNARQIEGREEFDRHALHQTWTRWNSCQDWLET